MNSKNKYIGWLLAVCSFMVSSCNGDYTDEQYEQYVSFKAPATTVTQIRVKYRKGEPSLYQLPLIVSGSTVNNNDLDVHVGIDNDTLAIFNYEHYFEREDLYYKQLTEDFYSVPSYDVHIPAGDNLALMDIYFNFDGLDLSENWVLPLIVKDDPSFNYKAHPRKNFNNALLWVTPFNDFSGTYGTTNLSVFPEDSSMPLVVSNREAYVVDEKTIFFYAGAIKERRPDRRFFKIYATFTPLTEDTGIVDLRADNPDINFQVLGQASYKISEMMDATRPALMRRTVTIENLNYTFVDPWETHGYTAKYKVTGTMTMQRNINTLIPDEEYAIEW